MLGPGHAWAGGDRQQVFPQSCPPAPEGAFKPIETHPEHGSQTSVARDGITTVPLSYRDGLGHICPFSLTPLPALKPVFPAAHEPSVGKLGPTVASASKDERPLAPPETRAKYTPRQLSCA